MSEPTATPIWHGELLCGATHREGMVHMTCIGTTKQNVALVLGNSAEESRQVANRILRALNSEAALREALKELLVASECADETGYVQDVGFMDLEAIQNKARAAIAQAEKGTL